jgi:hypothetical protein
MRGEFQPRFDENFDVYHREFEASLPRIGSLTIHVPQQETPLVIHGKRSRFPYIVEKEGDISKGKYGIVSRALECTSGDLYVVKRLIVNSKSKAAFAKSEIEINQKITHVSSRITLV